MTVMLIIYLKSKGYLEYVSQNHLHDIGKFLFGISVFWTYLWFDQFMLIWYANNGEETIYFKERMVHYPVLFWGNLLLNFATPFLILMRNDTKRKFGTMFFVALIVFFGHWWDYFYMIKPGARIAAHEAKELSEGKHNADQGHVAPMSEPKQEAHPAADHAAEAATEPAAEPAHSETAETAHADTAMASHEPPGGTEHPEEGTTESHPTEAAAAPHEAGAEAHAETEHGHDHDESKAFKLGYTIPGLEEIGVLIGFLCLFLFFFFNQLSKVSLVPLKDPFLEESLHHDTGALIEGEGGNAHH